MRNFGEHNSSFRSDNGVLRGPTGVPVDDGSQAFKDHINRRIEASYDESKRVSVEELMTMLKNDRQNRT